MLVFTDLIEELQRVSCMNYDKASAELIAFIEQAPDFLDILTQIGTIPEAIEHDSTAEKLFSKVSDAVLARAFREIGLKATVLRERADSADVLAESPIHGYTLVADAKAFRMSCTAKNQKDFKVTALSSWRNDNDFAVLCAPYFQYPSKSSQIYAQALEKNVCLLSWEHFIFLINNQVKENEHINFSELWNCSASFAVQTLVSDEKRCILPQLNQFILTFTNLPAESLSVLLGSQIEKIQARAHVEKDYWHHEMNIITSYSREQAIEELLNAKKIREKLAQIDSYVGGLKLL